MMMFDRDGMARRYASQHLKTDPETRAVYYLPKGADEREIRLLEINEQIAQLVEDPLEAVDFGVDTDSPMAHRLFVLDVTPEQWEKINREELRLPPGWSLVDAIPFARNP